MKFEMKKGNGKVYLGIPRERFMLPQFVDSRDQILAKLELAGLSAGYYQVDGHRVDRNRDRLVKQFLERTEAEWLLMIDSDMDYPPNLALRLLEYNKPIVGALYFHRGETHDPFVFKEGEDREDKYGRMQHTWISQRKLVYDFLVANGVPMRDGSFIVNNPIGEHLIECDAIATGAMLLHRSLLEAMKPPWFEYETGGISEDLAFCYRIRRELEVPIFCDISTVCGHYHMVAMGQAQFRMKYESHSINHSSFSKREAADMLSKFLGITEEKALKKIDSASAAVVNKLWEKKFGKKKPEELDPKDIAKFYKAKSTGQEYILELMHWNVHPNFTQLRSNLLSFHELDVIEIGSGIGTVAMQLLLQDNNVLAIETNALLRDFMFFRMNLYQEIVKQEFTKDCSIEGDDWITKTPEKSFDLAVAFDVFEHMPEDVLRKTLQSLSFVLRDKGTLIYHANFKQQDLYPMHYDHSQKWESILEEAGFKSISPVEAIKL